ncbi:hypothetical protein [Nocardioides marmoraquaticus]
MEPTRPLRERLAEADPSAMRARDRLRVLRATLGVIDGAEAVLPTARGGCGPGPRCCGPSSRGERA